MIRALLLLAGLFPFIASGATYYVSQSTGNDSNTGLSHAQAWKTVAKVNSTVSTTSDDVYFLCGDTWSENLLIDWSGTSGDRAVVGAYYMNPTETTGACPTQNKPTFQGNYPIIDSPTAIPTSSYNAMIKVKANYVTVENVRSYNSSGQGITVDSQGSYNNNIFDNVVSDISARHGIVFGRTSHTNILRNSTWTRCAEGTRDGLLPFPHPVCGGAIGSHSNTINNNFAYDNFGESIVSFGNGAYGNTIKDNTVICFRTVGIYMDNSYNNTVERNIVYGDANAPYLSCAGISVAVEDYANAQNSTGNIIRNNLIANLKTGFFSYMESAAQTAGRQIGFQFLGNTIVQADKVYNNLTPAANMTEEVVKNNIFDDAVDGVGGCQAPTGGDFDYNYKDQDWTDNDCDGANDITAGLDLTKSTGWALIGITNTVVAEDFAPVAAEAVYDAGVAHASLTEDYYETTRTAPPSMGAIEGAQTAPTVISSFPHFQNVGANLASNPSDSLDDAGATWVADDTLPTGCRVADTSPVSQTPTSTSDIVGVTDDEMYQTTRQKNGDIQYICTVTAGTYDVTVYGYERYWGITEGICDSNGSPRGFKITVNGVELESAHDWCFQAGAADTAAKYVIAGVDATDGDFSMTFGLGTDTDPKPSLSGFKIAVASPASNTLSIGNDTPTVTLDNQYPNQQSIDYINVCSISTTATTGGVPNAITPLSVDDTNLTSGTIEVIDPDLIYTAASAAVVQDAGSFIVTVSDGVETDTCTITVNQRGEKFITFNVKDGGVAITSSSGWDWCWFTRGDSMQADTMYCSTGSPGTTDANGNITITDDRLPEKGTDINVHVILYNKGSTTAHDTRPYRVVEIDRIKVQR